MGDWAQVASALVTLVTTPIELNRLRSKETPGLTWEQVIYAVRAYHLWGRSRVIALLLASLMYVDLC